MDKDNDWDLAGCLIVVIIILYCLYVIIYYLTTGRLPEGF